MPAHVSPQFLARHLGTRAMAGGTKGPTFLDTARKKVMEVSTLRVKWSMNSPLFLGAGSWF